ncbi:MAG TPA: hypothetical protein VFO80_01220 [Sphingomonas sp.]|nr:hypothetical protein [Sphingomonas sp.]
MTDQTPSATTTETDDRSDIEQAVDARRDALDRGEGGAESDVQMGEGGADGVVKNQDRDLGQ